MNSQLLYFLLFLSAWTMILHIRPFWVVETAWFADRAIRGDRFNLDTYVYDTICDELRNDVDMRYTPLAFSTVPIHAF